MALLSERKRQLACGYTGKGRFLNQGIVEQIELYWQKEDGDFKKKILITTKPH